MRLRLPPRAGGQDRNLSSLRCDGHASRPDRHSGKTAHSARADRGPWSAAVPPTGAPASPIWRGRGVSPTLGIRYGRGARVWGVQGGETVAGEGGALSISRSRREAWSSLQSVCARRRPERRGSCPGRPPVVRRKLASGLRPRCSTTALGFRLRYHRLRWASKDRCTTRASGHVVPAKKRCRIRAG